MGTERRENRKWAPTIESGFFLTQNISRKSKLSAMRDVKFTEISEVSESWFKFLRMVFPGSEELSITGDTHKCLLNSCHGSAVRLMPLYRHE